MNRREFLELLGTAGTSILTAPAAFATTVVAVPESHPAKLIYDGRYAIARECAKGLGEKGIASIDSAGDVIGLWFQDSGAFRLASGQVMQGYTTWSDFQALRGLIDDVRLGRDRRAECPRRVVLLQRNTYEERHGGSVLPCDIPGNQEKRVQLVSWLAYG